MKRGIHLGPPLRRPTLIRVALGVLLGVTALNVLDAWRVSREVGRLRTVLADERAMTPTAEATADTEGAARRLRALGASGALESHAPTVLLALIERALPPGLSVSSVTVSPGAQRGSILVEARAERESDLTAFQKSLAASPLVAETRLVEERRAAGSGGLLVRLEANLEAPR